MDIEFVEMVHPWIRVPATYAGGCRLLQDLVVLERHSNSLMDLSMGSACDVYGGTGVKLEELVQWNKDVAKGSHAKKAEAFHRPSLSGDELEAEFKKFASGMGSVATGFGELMDYVHGIPISLTSLLRRLVQPPRTRRNGR